MDNLKKMLSTAFAAGAALGLAAPASAGSFAWAPGHHTISAPVGAAAGDGLFIDGVGYVALSDKSNATGIISSGIADGVGIALQDHDLDNTEGGNPSASDSDYLYVYQNVLYFDGDSETSIPILSNPVNRAGFSNAFETGDYQDVTSAFGTAQGVFLFSDTGVPEPATWAMMLVGFGLAGAALRRRRQVVVA